MTPEWIADNLSEFLGWPSDALELADRIEKISPGFDKEKFVLRAINKWEEVHPIDIRGDDCEDAAWKVI